MDEEDIEKYIEGLLKNDTFEICFKEIIKRDYNNNNKFVLFLQKNKNIIKNMIITSEYDNYYNIKLKEFFFDILKKGLYNYHDLIQFSISKKKYFKQYI
jgi:hypothetical protein